MCGTQTRCCSGQCQFLLLPSKHQGADGTLLFYYVLRVFRGEASIVFCHFSIVFRMKKISGGGKSRFIFQAIRCHAAVFKCAPNSGFHPLLTYSIWIVFDTLIPSPWRGCCCETWEKTCRPFLKGQVSLLYPALPVVVKLPDFNPRQRFASFPLLVCLFWSFREN